MVSKITNTFVYSNATTLSKSTHNTLVSKINKAAQNTLTSYITHFISLFTNFSLRGFITQLKFNYQLNRWASNSGLTTQDQEEVKAAFKAAFNGSKELHISHKSIATLPPLFKHLSHLEKLTITGTQVKALPDDLLEHAKHLKVLNFSSNGHFEGGRAGVFISRSIDKLQELTTLDISNQLIMGDQFTSALPTQVKNMKKLTVLNITNTDIEKKHVSYLNLNIIGGE